MEISSLSTYLGTTWFTSDKMDQLLEELIRKMAPEKYQLQGLGFINSLLAIHAKQEAELSRMLSFDQLGRDLATGSCLIAGGFANICSNHWIAWPVDSLNWTLHYGDSQGNTIDPKIHGAIDWWVSMHMEKPLQVRSMPISA